MLTPCNVWRDASLRESQAEAPDYAAECQIDHDLQERMLEKGASQVDVDQQLLRLRYFDYSVLPAWQVVGSTGALAL